MSSTPEALDIATLIQLAAALGAVLCLAAAAIEDGWRYRISNVLVIAIAVCFAAFAAAEGSWADLGWSLAAGACVLAIAAVPFAFGVFGGGDTKLIAVMALWTQFGQLPRFLLVMSAFGGVLGVIWMVRRRLAPQPAPAEVKPAEAKPAETPAAEKPASAQAEAAVSPEVDAAPHAPFSKLPYGIAIALAGLDFFLLGPASPLAGWLPF